VIDDGNRKTIHGLLIETRSIPWWRLILVSLLRPTHHYDAGDGIVIVYSRWFGKTIIWEVYDLKGRAP